VNTASATSGSRIRLTESFIRNRSQERTPNDVRPRLWRRRIVALRRPSTNDRYTSAMLLILVALGLAIFGTIHLTRSLEPGQRVVAWLVFILGVVYLFSKLVQMGILGRASGGES